MPASSPPFAGPASVSTALARNRLGPFAISAAISSSVAPMTVAVLIVSTALAVTALLGVPIAMIAVAVVLMIFAVGFLAMARHIQNAGAFYAYVARGLGRPLGVGTSWVALATYNSFQLCCYGAIGAIVPPLLDQWIGIKVPWLVCAFIACAAVALLGANEISLSEKVLVLLVVTETVLVVLYSIAITATPGFTFNVAALSPARLWGPAAGVLLVIGGSAFAGVEQSAVYIEESKNRLRTIPRATYGTILGILVVYVFTSLVQISAGGPQIIDKAVNEGPDLFFNQAAAVLGEWVVQVGKVFLACSAFAAALSFHNAVARYTFALGREGVLPRRFGLCTSKGAPRNASLAQTVFAGGVLVLYAIMGWDPLVQLFYWGSQTGGLGVLLLITLTSIAVIAFFARDPRGEKLWHRLIAPGIATVILLAGSYLAIDNLATLYGAPGPAEVVPLAALAIFAAGTAWGLILKGTRPAVYDGIGRGTHATTTASALLPEGTPR